MSASRERTTALLLLPGAFGPAGGLEMYCRLVIKAFGELIDPHDCKVLILNDSPNALDARYVRDGMALSAFSGRRLAFVRAAIREVVRSRPQIVVCGHVHFGSLALALRALHPAGRQWFLTYGIECWKRLPLLQRFALRAADRVVSISEYTRDIAVRENDIDVARTALLPCALDPYLQAGQTERTSERPVLLTVARLSAAEKYKGVEHVIAALPVLLKTFPDVEYRVVGDGDDRSRLEAIAERCGVAAHVRFLGRLPAAALADEYQRAAIFVMPSEREGFGIVFLEAALFRKPSIGGNSGGTPEVIRDGETGYLVEYGNVAQLTGRIASLLANASVRDEMGRAAYDRLKSEFTYESFRATLSGALSAAAIDVRSGIRTEQARTP